MKKVIYSLSLITAITLNASAKGDYLITSILSPASMCEPSKSEQKISAAIFNNGKKVLKEVTLTYKFDDNEVTESIQCNIPPQQMSEVAFSSKADFTKKNTYRLKISSAENSEERTALIFNGPRNVEGKEYANDFENELSGWETMDSDSDGMSWRLTYDKPISGKLTAILPVGENDEFLFTPCFTLNKQELYRIRFICESITAGKSGLEVFLSSSQNSSGKLKTVFSSVADEGRKEMVVDFIPETDRPVYIGFSGVENRNGIKIDELKVSKVLSAQSNSLMISPNPSSGIVEVKSDLKGKITISDQSGKILKIIEVDGKEIVDLSDYPTGSYNFRMEAGGIVSSTTLVLTR